MYMSKDTIDAVTDNMLHTACSGRERSIAKRARVYQRRFQSVALLVRQGNQESGHRRALVVGETGRGGAPRSVSCPWRDEVTQQAHARVNQDATQTDVELWTSFGALDIII